MYLCKDVMVVVGKIVIEIEVLVNCYENGLGIVGFM